MAAFRPAAPAAGDARVGGLRARLVVELGFEIGEQKFRDRRSANEYIDRSPKELPPVIHIFSFSQMLLFIFPFSMPTDPLFKCLKDSYSNEYLFDKFGFDRAENEPCEVWG